MIKIIIPAVPPSINKYIGRGRGAAFEYREQKQGWLDLVYCYSQCRKSKDPISHAIVTVTFYFKTRRRHDGDNYVKFVLDGLVHAGIIADDSTECIIELRIRGGHDKQNPRTEVLVEEI